MVLVSWVTSVSVRGLALDDDVDLDGDLLAAAHHQQVGVLDVAADRVDVERLGQRELLLALDVEGEHGVGAGVSQHGGEVMRRTAAGAAGRRRGRRAPRGSCRRAERGAMRPCRFRCARQRSGCWHSGRSLGHGVAPLMPVIRRARPGSQLRRCVFPSITVACKHRSHPRRDARPRVSDHGPQSANLVPVSCSDSSHSARGLLARRGPAGCGPAGRWGRASRTAGR